MTSSPPRPRVQASFSLRCQWIDSRRQFQFPAELTASDGTGNAYLGAGVGINNAAIVAAAPKETDGTNLYQGAVYVFNKPAGGWTNMTETSKITTAGGLRGDGFGNALGLSGGTMVATAPFANQLIGAAYIFGQ